MSAARRGVNGSRLPPDEGFQALSYEPRRRPSSAPTRGERGRAPVAHLRREDVVGDGGAADRGNGAAIQNNGNGTRQGDGNLGGVEGDRGDDSAIQNNGNGTRQGDGNLGGVEGGAASGNNAAPLNNGDDRRRGNGNPGSVDVSVGTNGLGGNNSDRVTERNHVGFDLGNGNGRVSILDTVSSSNNEFSWKTAPDRGNFNPGTQLGQKIFLEKSKGLPDGQKLDLTLSNGPALHRFFKSKQMNIQSALDVVTLYDQRGNPQRTANILQHYNNLSLDDVQREGHKLFQEDFNPFSTIRNPKGPFLATTLDPGNNAVHQQMFYNVVNNNVAVKVIENTLTVAGYEQLLRKSNMFSYVNSIGEIEFHAGTMYYLVYDKIDPTTDVRMECHLAAIQGARLNAYENDVDAMLTDIEYHYGILDGNEQAPRNIRRLLFDALASGQNSEFIDFIKRMEDNKKIDPNDIISEARSRYNNMVKRKTWNKIDPRNAEIMVLTTKVEQLQGELERATRNGAALATNQSSGSDDSRVSVDIKDHYNTWAYVPGTTVYKWRAINQGDIITVHGRTYYWCKHHIWNGKWNGLYVTHKPEECNLKDKNKNGSAGGADSGTSSDKESIVKEAKLQLKEGLKSVLMTSLCISNEDVDRLLEQAGEQGN